MSRSTASAVKVLLPLAMAKRVCAVFGTRSARCAYPSARSKRRSSPTSTVSTPVNEAFLTAASSAA